MELPEDGTLIVSRKITPSRSISKINDETVTAGRLREITGLLIDIHGQHEHQSLLYKSNAALDCRLCQIPDHAFKRTYCRLFFQLSGTDPEPERNGFGPGEPSAGRWDFLRFEIGEIEEADIKEGEEEELDRRIPADVQCPENHGIFCRRRTGR